MEEIKNYYVIGDLHSAALVSKDASIDWLCLPHFDSPSIFARLLDSDAGSFSIDTDTYTVSSHYVTNTAIVRFHFNNKQSEFIVTDFMVPQPSETCENHFLVRKFIGKKGVSQVNMLFNPKPEFAKSIQNMNFGDELDLEVPVGEDAIFIYPPENSSVAEVGDKYHISFTLHEGEEAVFVMEYTVKNGKPKYKDQNFESATREFWESWVAKGKYFDFHKSDLIRSAITLKLMQYYPTGAIIAAPTTSLPETIGGVRNWDYRYVWIRDATFTLYALYVLGYTDEGIKFFDFIQNITEQSEEDTFDVSLMYTIEGKKVPKESLLPHLSGYKNSKPVRIGNGAHDQFQLDVYGSLIDAYYFVSKRGYTIDEKHKKMIVNLVEKINKMWMEKDHGIWEVRSGKQHFTYSKVMCWVGVNRALRMQKVLGLSEKQVTAFWELEREIHDWIWENCYDHKKQTFLQYPQAENQDATNLLFVLLQFLDKRDPRTRAIIENTCSELSRKGVYVYRYLSQDGLAGEEGAFLLCTCWLIAAWAIIEDTDKAQSLFAKFTHLINSVGLLSEELDVNTGEYLGNYPQAFSHIGYIMSTYYLVKYLNKKQ
jgi:GH15 family glucan-1,4-alpha-glucosidase